MKFYFPDSQDLVDPSFDFDTEQRSEHRVRHRDDLYAHELFDFPPFDGILVSKGIVDGLPGAAGKYTMAQRNRLMRTGIRSFFRLDRRPEQKRIETMGDCGAFTYVKEQEPAYSVDQVFDFYATCGFDAAMSVDHVILAFSLGSDAPVADGVRDRQELTLDLAAQFLARCQKSGQPFEPIGVAQGWSPRSYAYSVSELQKQGYSRIALGGMVPLKNHEIMAVLDAVADVHKEETRLHLLGINRLDMLSQFAARGVSSFDSTSPLRQAFKDAKANYHTHKRTYVAVRVPMVEGSPKLQKLIAAGKVNHDEARRLERGSLDALQRYEAGRMKMGRVLDVLEDYEALHDGRKSRRDQYAETLEDAPWRTCSCEVCRAIGINVIIFRGAERNRRRGFHNVSVLWRRLGQLLEADQLEQGDPRHAA